MSDNHKISEFIDGISFRKTVGGGLNPDDVYDSICQLTSLYNSVLAESYSENDELKKKLEEIAASTRSGRTRYFYSEQRDQANAERPYKTGVQGSDSSTYIPTHSYRDDTAANKAPRSGSVAEESTRRDQLQRDIDRVYKQRNSYASDNRDTETATEVDFKSAFGRDYSFKAAPSNEVLKHSDSEKNSGDRYFEANEKVKKSSTDKKDATEGEIRLPGDHSMTSKELRRLKRGDLLELLIEQGRETARLRDHISNLDSEVSELSKKLNDRTIKLNKAGTIAEASFILNDVLESTEAAAAQYLDNLRALNESESLKFRKKEAETEELVERMLADAKDHCDRLMRATEEKCSAMTHAVKQQCDAMRSDTLSFCESIEDETRIKCEELEEHTKISCESRERQAAERCRELEMKTQQSRAKCLDDVSKRMDEFYKLQDYFRDIFDKADSQHKN